MMEQCLHLSDDVRLRKDKWAMLRAVLGEFRTSDKSAVSRRTGELADKLWNSLSSEDL